LLDAYATRKARSGGLDYEDLIATTGELLARDGVAAWVLFKLDGGIEHVLVDEAQDTNPAQWRIVQALTEEFFSGLGAIERPRTVFAVGDEKQSIFSFQGADPREFARMRAHFSSRSKEAERDWREVPLNVSFRSTEPVLRLVDRVFANDAARAGVATAPIAAIAAAAVSVVKVRVRLIASLRCAGPVRPAISCWRRSSSAGDPCPSVRAACSG
jgi:ATP-dependent helicase/nuclease subunit A